MRFIVVCALLFIGCGESATSPTSPAGGTTLTSGLNTVDVTGVVRDSILRPLPDARVEIAEGPAAGHLTATDAGGRFAFTGVRHTDGVVLLISKSGYSPVRVTLRNRLDTAVTLTSLDLPNLLGRYHLRFTAARSCSQLPEALRARTFSATIAAGALPSTVIVALAGPDVLPGYTSFSGSIADDAALLTVFSRDARDWWLEDLPIIERVSATTFLAFSGIATLPVGRTGARLAGTFDGTYAYCSSAGDAVAPNFPLACHALTECRSDAHEILLMPQ